MREDTFTACEDCIFAIPVDGSAWMAECHRHAPRVVQVLADDGGGMTVWPLVGLNEPGSGCGEGSSDVP